MYKKFMEEVMAKKKPTAEEPVAWKEKYSANSLEQKIPNKQEGSWNVHHKLGIKNVSDIKTNLKFEDHSRKDAYGITEDVLVTIEELSFPVDFVILDIPEDDEAPIIPGRPFMQTSRCNLDMDQGTLTLKVHDKEIRLNAIEDPDLEEDTESHYQVCLIRTKARRKSNIPTS
ncbi:hypothetical protein KIW84_073161 [Lathyrus oleraceus]|uniref:Uncharacterized protein n=1 Tax=Pisum sativum TaxID=3888 RepID=A0A9D4VP87_PEA|nr:hypothetical protein KIW84_073161 [Pisum sativum]